MSEHFTRDILNELLNVGEQPCLSLYMPTYRAFPDTNQDPIRFKNLLRELREQLTTRFPDEDADSLLAPFEAYRDDRDFWLHQRHGLAMLGGKNFFRVFSLGRPVPERVVANVHPHLAPLMRIAQSADCYQVLCLTRDEVRLFEGNRDALEEITPAPEVPLSITDALGTDLTEGNQAGRPDGFGAASQRGDPLMHGAGGLGKQHEIDLDRERFFRALDRQIIEHHSKPSGLPLILAALPENQAAFRSVTHNQQLMEDGVEIDHNALDIETLRERCWEAMSKHYVSRLDSLLDRWGHARGTGMAGDDLGEIGRGAIAGRISTMLVEAERTRPGKLDHESGQVTLLDDDDSAIDVLDELAMHAMRNGAEVVIVPADKMPTSTGAAAVYRF